MFIGLATKLQDPPVSGSPVTRSKAQAVAAGFSVGPGDLNSQPCVSTGSISLTEPSHQPHVNFPQTTNTASIFPTAYERSLSGPSWEECRFPLIFPPLYTKPPRRPCSFLCLFLFFGPTRLPSAGEGTLSRKQLDNQEGVL